MMLFGKVVAIRIVYGKEKLMRLFMHLFFILQLDVDCIVFFAIQKLLCLKMAPRYVGNIFYA